MDLGYCNVRRAHCNILFCALHDTHGIAWTDGRVIYLAAVNISNQEVEYAQPLKLGEFEHVESVHWSSEFPAANDATNCHSFSFMCVLHKDSVSLWKVSGMCPNLSFKQVRKIHIQTIAKGCLWNPNRDILCLLSKEKASFYFNHTQTKGSYSLPSIESGQINCGCWSGDGKRLVLGVGAVVLIYQWQDIDDSITDYTIVAWKIPGVTGHLNTLTCCGDDRILCTAELPLDQICSTQESLFHIPDLSLFEGTKKLSSSSGSGSSHGDSSSTQSPDSDTIGQSAPSHISSLLNLQRNTQVMKQDASQLILFGLQGKTLEPHKIASQNLQGVLAPDLLYYQGSTGTVVVGSNTHTVLAVSSLQDDTIVPGLMLQLNDDERPKGLCGCVKTGKKNAEGILVAVATVDRNDNAFLPVSMYSKYKLSLRYFSLPGQSTRTFVQNPKDIPNTKMFREIQLPNGSSKVHLLRIGPLKNQSNINENNSRDMKLFPEKLGNNFTSDSRSNSSCDSSSTNSSLRPDSPLCNLVLPGQQELVLNNEKISRGKAVVPLSPMDDKELEVETQSFDEKPRDFKNMKLVQMFEKPPVALSKMKSEDNLADCASSSPQVVPSNRDVFMTCAPTSVSHDPVTPLDMSFPVAHEIFTGKMQVSSRQDKELFTNQFDRHGIKVHRGDSGKASVSTSENSLSGQPNTAVTAQQLEQLEGRLTKQENALGHVQDRICFLERCKCALFPEEQYAAADSADMIYLTFVHSKEDRDQGERKAFLLDQGRLKLNIVKESFSIFSLEMLLGGEWCVLGCNSQGYIPLLFQSESSYLITGNLKESLKC